MPDLHRLFGGVRRPPARQPHELPEALAPVIGNRATDQQPPSGPHAQSVDGAVWVANGRVRVENPTGLGRWPILRIEEGHGIHVYVGGTLRTGEVVVRAEDEIRVQVEVVDTPPHVELSVSPDGLKAWATVRPGHRQTQRLEDTRPALECALTAVATVEPAGGVCTAADVEAALAARSIRVGIDPGGVSRALSQPGVAVLVAEGRAPSAGRPASVWTAVHGEVGAPVEAALVPDAAERRTLAAGEPVVRLIPGVPSEPGESVTGDSIAGPEVWIPHLIAGVGVLLSADGCTAIAARSGRPYVTFDRQSVRILVSPEREIHGDVDEALGDVSFDGDVWVSGNVDPGRTVTASGHIEVVGRVVRSILKAKAGVRIHGGAANALIVAGQPTLPYAETIRHCRETLEHLAMLSQGDADAVRPHVNAVQSAAANLERLYARVDPPFDRCVASLLYLLPALADLPLKPLQGDVIGKVETVIQAVVEHMGDVLAHRGACYVRHLDNSQVEVSGDLIIGEGGARQARVAAHGAIRVLGPVYGGSYTTWSSATFVSLGASSDHPTRVTCAGGGGCDAALVHPGTVVTQGPRTREFDQETRDVHLPPVGVPPHTSQLAQDPGAALGTDGDRIVIAPSLSPVLHP